MYVPILEAKGEIPMRYTKDHEWLNVEGDIATIGITDYAQSQLGDVVFVELPEIGRSVTQGGDAAIVESVKAASDVYGPISGTVTETNAALESDPALVNTAPESDGWFFKLKISDLAELDELMDAESYAAFVASLG
jgi:glycine cleavage system H protein